MAPDARKHENVARAVDPTKLQMPVSEDFTNEDAPEPVREKGRSKERQTHICFVLMPFRSDFDAVYENAIRPAVNSSRGLSCLRADEIYGPRPIMADVWRSIRQARLIVADLTGRNPNGKRSQGVKFASY